MSDLIVLPRAAVEALLEFCESADADDELVDPGGVVDDLRALLAAAKPVVDASHWEIVGSVLVDGPQGRCRYSRDEKSDTNLMMVPLNAGHQLLIAADAAEEG